MDEYEPERDSDPSTKKKYNPIFESLKVFAQNIDPETQEWIIPQEEIS